MPTPLPPSLCCLCLWFSPMRALRYVWCQQFLWFSCLSSGDWSLVNVFPHGGSRRRAMCWKNYRNFGKAHWWRVKWLGIVVIAARLSKEGGRPRVFDLHFVGLNSHQNCFPRTMPPQNEFFHEGKFYEVERLIADRIGGGALSSSREISSGICLKINVLFMEVG